MPARFQFIPMRHGIHKQTLAARLPHRLAIRTAVCLFLLVAASFAQVAHSHKLALGIAAAGSSVTEQHHSPHSNPLGSEETCLLCVTMHSVLAGAIFTAIATALLAILSVSLYQQRPTAQLWLFCLFSRPPPCLL